MRTLEVQEWVAVAVGAVVVAFMFFGGSIAGLFSSKAAASPAGDFSTTASTTTEMKNISTTAGLEIYDETIGAGAEAVAGRTVTAHYVGTLTNGFKFDSSVDRGQPFSFSLGAGQVIKGWDLGIQGMKVGGKRRLVISPELGYGSQAVGGVIPANSTLVFEVELLGVK